MRVLLIDIVSIPNVPIMTPKIHNSAYECLCESVRTEQQETRRKESTQLRLAARKSQHDDFNF